jgi:VIT1/CCC1 family predicted Fe2+/Mn2+ transporter
MIPVTTGRAILDPTERLAEVMFGLLMVLSFTGTMSVAVSEGDQIHAVLMAALACNVAWGIVDAVMWVVLTGVDRVRDETRRTALLSGTAADAREVLADRLPSLDAVLTDGEIEGVLDRIRAMPPEAPARFVTGREAAGACVIFLLVTGATLPPSIPFLLMSDIDVAMRVSNAIALVMLFVIGARLGRVMGRGPWPMALAMSGIGTVLVLITIALGG